MIDFNREQFSENNEENFNQKLEENLKMQRDCEINIERCREAKDEEGLEKTEKTLEILKAEEKNIREQMEN